jgi:hypothetical protein
MGNAISDIGNGFKDIFEGVVDEAIGVVPGIFYLQADLTKIAVFVGVFIFTNFICGLKSLSNLTSCMMYYLLDIFGCILYLPITIFVFVLSLLHLPAYSWEKQIWAGLDKIDQKIYKFTKIHIIHYSKSIRNKCYNCKRLKISVFGEIISEFMNDVEGPIYSYLFSGIIQAFNGVIELLQGFMELVQAVLFFL